MDLHNLPVPWHRSTWLPCCILYAFFFEALMFLPAGPLLQSEQLQRIVHPVPRLLHRDHPVCPSTLPIQHWLPLFEGQGLFPAYRIACLQRSAANNACQLASDKTDPFMCLCPWTILGNIRHPYLCCFHCEHPFFRSGKFSLASPPAVFADVANSRKSHLFYIKGKFMQPFRCLGRLLITGLS